MNLHIIQSLTDDVISYMVVLASVLFITLGIHVPEWWSVGFGMALMNIYNNRRK